MNAGERIESDELAAARAEGLLGRESLSELLGDDTVASFENFDVDRSMPLRLQIVPGALDRDDTFRTNLP